jgi:hypothetical protein
LSAQTVPLHAAIIGVKFASTRLPVARDGCPAERPKSVPQSSPCRAGRGERAVRRAARHMGWMDTMHNVIAEDGSRRQHRQRLRRLLETTPGTVRVASAYVTESELLLGVKGRDVRILTPVSTMDIVSGATSLQCLRSLIEAGVQCRYLPDGPRFHAKVYIFGEQFAVVTSANLTASAMDTNVEVGVQLTGSDVGELNRWFDAFWKRARPLVVEQLADWQQATDGLRLEHNQLRERSARALPALRGEDLPLGEPQKALRSLLDGKAIQFLCCNTFRNEGAPTSDGGYELEEKMRSRGYAAAWEIFQYPTHMDRVNPGDAIFMYAKDLGIIGVGRAKEKLQILKTGDPDRISDRDEPEWRVPVDWLAWRSNEGVKPNGPNGKPWGPRGFSDVTKYSDLLEAVRRHFLG